MANPFGRTGRRRRVLNEESLSASSLHVAYRPASSDGGATADCAPRYSEAAGLENQPQVTQFVPRRFRSIAMLALFAVVSTAALESLHWFVVPLARTYGPSLAMPLTLGAAGSIATWLSAALLGTSAVVCLLIYSLRRHRIDDYRGRYRVWLAAGGVCLLLSLNRVAPMHDLVATVVAHHTGQPSLANHAIGWWLFAGLPLAWIAGRVWLDARESRLAAVTLVVAPLLYGASMLDAVGGWPLADPSVQPMLTAGAILLGHWMLLIGLISYGRYVLLDAQGLIPVRHAKRVPLGEEVKTAATPRPRRRGRAKSDQDEPDASEPHSVGPQSVPFKQPAAKAAPPPPESQGQPGWTDGSESEDDHSVDEGGGQRKRKLSKAERKRIRRQKARNRVA